MLGSRNTQPTIEIRIWMTPEPWDYCSSCGKSYQPSSPVHCCTNIYTFKVFIYIILYYCIFMCRYIYILFYIIMYIYICIIFYYLLLPLSTCILSLSIYIHIHICIHMYIVPANDVPSTCIFKRDPRVDPRVA